MEDKVYILLYRFKKSGKYTKPNDQYIATLKWSDKVLAQEFCNGLNYGWFGHFGETYPYYRVVEEASL